MTFTVSRYVQTNFSGSLAPQDFCPCHDLVYNTFLKTCNFGILFRCFCYPRQDLAQLIHDLHAVNEEAGVSVKLVSSVGIGTVACGVAKADADVIQISGGDGGTGASPLSSIKNAGCPWELGLSEAHSALLNNGLRDRVTIRVDGGIRTGRDIAIAAMMGAEEFGFGTIAMIAEGCVMARVCHLNTCPVGVTSQKEELRKKFPGTPEHVVNFFEFVAEEVRQLMAHLGYSKFEDLIGRADLLKQSAEQIERIAKSDGVNVDKFFYFFFLAVKCRLMLASGRLVVCRSSQMCAKTSGSAPK